MSKRKTSLFPLQDSIFERLNNDSAIKAKVTGVFDSVPKNQPCPYIALGEDTVNDWSTKLEFGEEITHTLHVWSEYDGKKEVKEIMSLILEAMTDPLSLDGGFSVEITNLDFMQVLDDPDGISKHGIIRFRFKILQ
ncbi:DUF3168 domain-containing protein [Mesobacillus foraminis]|uniref:Uncharacterized protein DUF3168 n=1 Tax=Mesobacillus foraminis TaxID=279826 RepID=A0A4R2BHS6_9BACI|nr:DUF3168 domain-containing protein [Mesobacillus foraminis]TCN25484.1 uncharacterized protein DUF3168 [Mesobacillus foraminis]